MDPHNAFMRFGRQPADPAQGVELGLYHDPCSTSCQRGAQHADPKDLDKVLARINTHMVDQAVRLVRPRRVAERDLGQGEGHVHPRAGTVDSRR